MESRTLEFEDHQVAGFVYGRGDENLQALEKALGVDVSARGTVVTLRGDEAALRLASTVLVQLYDLVAGGHPVGPAEVDRSVRILQDQPDIKIGSVFLDTIFTTNTGRNLAPKGLNQKKYVDAIRRDDIVFGVGPAGTGKTYLAMAMALAALQKKEVKRVVLTRPAVEAGEKLGFLPGDLFDKVSPYLRPLYDALHDMLDYDKAQLLLERSTIEVAPLAFMRGRTLNNAFVILDEAQNTTPAQMKMFLTRLGFDSRAVITGDITQIDLPQNGGSGLVDATRVLEGVRGISVCKFTREDVVRHPLVMKIIEAYERSDAQREAARKMDEADLRARREARRAQDLAGEPQERA
jgi:phosphate starvation-inducible protein PhoH and related proteins